MQLINHDFYKYLITYQFHTMTNPSICCYCCCLCAILTFELTLPNLPTKILTNQPEQIKPNKAAA